MVIKSQEKREQEKKGTKENYKNKLKTSNKMSVSIYQSVITLNVNRLKAPIKKTKWLNEQKTRYTLPPARDSLHIYKHTQVESESEIDFPCKWKKKKE